MNLDDMIRQMQEDEAADQVDVTGEATPINYARSRGIFPQRVYGWIRRGKLETHNCACGRRVVFVSDADALLGGRNADEPVAEEPDAGTEDGSGSAERDAGC